MLVVPGSSFERRSKLTRSTCLNQENRPCGTRTFTCLCPQKDYLWGQMLEEWPRTTNVIYYIIIFGAELRKGKGFHRGFRGTDFRLAEAKHETFSGRVHVSKLSVFCQVYLSIVYLFVCLCLGRASATPSLDLFITFLSLGSTGYQTLLSDRKVWVLLMSASFLYTKNVQYTLTT